MMKARHFERTDGETIVLPERRTMAARPFVQRQKWCIPAVCNPVVQHKATLRVSMLAGLMTLGLFAAPEMRGASLEKAMGPSILVSAPEIVSADRLVEAGQARRLAKGEDRVPSLADITSSAPVRAGHAEGEASVVTPAAKITPLDQTEVVDAMTVRAGDLVVRLAGIEGPKNGEMCRRLDGLAVPCLDRAVSYLQLLVRGKSIACIKSGLSADGTNEGRCRMGETDLAEQLVRQGWAKAGPKPEERMVTAELAARRQNLGIWRKETN